MTKKRTNGVGLRIFLSLSLGVHVPTTRNTTSVMVIHRFLTGNEGVPITKRRLNLFKSKRTHRLTRTNVRFLRATTLRVNTTGTTLRRNVTRGRVIPTRRRRATLNVTKNIPSNGNRLVRNRLFPLLVTTIHTFRKGRLTTPTINELAMSPNLPLPTRRPYATRVIVITINTRSNNRHHIILFRGFVMLLRFNNKIGSRYVTHVKSRSGTINVGQHDTRGVGYFRVLCPSGYSSIPTLPKTNHCR